MPGQAYADLLRAVEQAVDDADRLAELSDVVDNHPSLDDHERGVLIGRIEEYQGSQELAAQAALRDPPATGR